MKGGPEPVMITAAVTGSITTRDDNPALPLSTTEIADSAVDCWRAGAAIIHLHARDPEGLPTQDADVYSEIVEKIRSRECDAVLNLSTGEAGGRATDFDARLELLRLEPEMATLDCGSVNFGDERILQGPFVFLRDAAERMRKSATIPEIEVFDSGMIGNARRLIAEGLIDPPSAWQIVVGLRGGAAADLGTVSYLTSRLPEGAVWSLLGIGRHQLAANVVSLAYGGHIRTGLEDNVYFRPGELAEGNQQLVERVVALAREFGRPVATPDQVRERLNIAT